MITVPWWMLLLAASVGIAVTVVMVTIWIGRIDALVLARVDVRLEELLAVAPQLEPEPGGPVDPWASLQSVHDGLPDITAPELPEHTWWGQRTGSLPIVPLVEPEATEAVVEVVAEEPKSNPRKRFNKEPKLPKEISVTTIIAEPDDADAAAEVRSEKVKVKS